MLPHKNTDEPPLWRVMLSARMWVALLMGFACGLPLLVTGSLLQAWMKTEQVDLGTIGLFALVGLPYTTKFLWAPLLDRFTPPLFGRRRGWLLASQLALMLAMAGLALSQPAANPMLVAALAALVAFFSASQDIVVDAYRRESLEDRELGLGSSLYVAGYRTGMLFAGGGGLILADHLSFRTVYLLLAASMLAAVVTTLAAREPPVSDGAPRCLRDAVVEPFLDYFRRPGALLILAFILLYKLGDTLAAAMTTPFYLDVGFSMSEVGAVVKLFGFWAIVGGGVLGGVLMLRLGIHHALWTFGLLQAASTAGFALLALVGHSVPWLAVVIAFENLSAGMGTAAYMAFMASLTNKQFTATQYALLSSLMGVPRVILSAPSGFLAEGLGWVGFFLLCTAVAVPGLLLLTRMAPLTAARPAAAVS